MKPSVYLTGGDGMNWALDDDLRLTREALAGVVRFTSLPESQVVHAMWWSGLAHLPAGSLIGKRVISHVPGEPFRYMRLPDYMQLAPKVGLWIAQSRQAADQLRSVRAPHRLIPYTVDPALFRPLNPGDPELVRLRQQWRIPAHAYLVGNFHRDTEGNDLRRPKLVKGPDIFLEIVAALHQLAPAIHVLLAGPRRHWLRRQLASRAIPFTYVGREIDGDDALENNLPQAQLNLLYNLLDVYLVTSRSEGGPRTLLEAAAAGCKVASPPVGLAPELLPSAALFADPAAAVTLLQDDIRADLLAPTVAASREAVQRRHVPLQVRPLFADLYADLEAVPVYQGPTSRQLTLSSVRAVQQGYTRLALAAKVPPDSVLRRVWRRWVRPGWRRIRQRQQRRRPRRPSGGADLTVGLWHDFRPPPYGGGNQFMLALRRGLLDRGVRVVENRLDAAVDVYLLNAIHFDVPRFLAAAARRDIRIVHRIDGPIHLIRGTDREKDELCYRLNASLATSTIIQSAWTLQRIVEDGYQPVNAVVINNAADPDLFYPGERPAPEDGRRVRLISTSWSDNPRKGGPVYKWLEAHLDWQRYEYTFVGRASEQFARIRQLDPVPSAELGRLLRQQDIYITASQNDPCSNALIEALSCGLPALYLADGGHPELVGSGGLPFAKPDEALRQLDRLADNYALFQRLVQVTPFGDVLDRYLAVLQAAAG